MVAALVPTLPVVMVNGEGESVVASSPREYWQAVWGGFTVSGPVPAPPRSAVPAHLSDLDALSATFERLPSSALAAMRASFALRDTTPVYVVAAGSSTTAGNNATLTARRYVNRLGGYIKAAFPGGTDNPVEDLPTAYAARATVTSGIKVVNAGWGGTTAADYLDVTRKSQIAALAPRVVLHMVGSNDYTTAVPIATYKANVKAAIDAIDAGQSLPPVHILVQSYERGANPGEGAIPWAQYGQALRELAEADPSRRMFVDLSPTYYQAQVPGLDPLNLLDVDNTHQTDAGHALMADLLRDALRLPPSGSTAGVATPPSGQVRVLDSFTAADGVAIIGRAPEVGTGTWGGAGTGSILGGKLRSAGSAVFATDAGASDVTVAADVTIPAEAGSMGVTCRSSVDGSTRLSAYWGGGAILLAKVVNNTITSLANGTGPAPVGAAPTVGQTYRLQLDVRGSAVTVSINGVTAVTYTLTTQDLADLNGMTRVGIRAGVATATGVFDNFVART